MTPELFPCLGITNLGMCTYNPAQPGLIYFGIGDAIAALGFTLAVQQLLKPIYLFRLRAYGLRIIYLASSVFAGALCSFIATAMPNLPISHKGTIEYPIFWEMLGGFLIASAYGIAAIISLKPARINSLNLLPFVSAAAALLSAADDDDRVGFAEDMLRGRNIERLMKYASAWKKAEMHGADVEFDRLRAIGAPLLITGQPPISQFYLFAHRKELDLATIAETFLRILSDPEFCSVLVRKCPWLTSAAIDRISAARAHDRSAEPFIREIANQAILSDESIVTKEVSYTGFRAVPLLSASLFGRWFILSHYDPLNRIDTALSSGPSETYVERLNGASKMMLQTAIANKDYWPHGYMGSVERAYATLSRRWSYTRNDKKRVDFAVSLHMGIAELYRVLLIALANLEWDRKIFLFIKDRSRYDHNLVHVIASTVYESLECIANKFSGVQDEAWSHAVGVFLDIYPPFESEPPGMNPLQQHLALKLLDTLRQNMRGFYPAISRVLLAVIGPYDRYPATTTRTAHVILRDCVYRELRNFSSLYDNKGGKATDFIPDGVRYDSRENSFVHTYGSGKTTTRLSFLSIPDIDLTDGASWQTPSAGRVQP